MPDLLSIQYMSHDLSHDLSHRILSREDLYKHAMFEAKALPREEIQQLLRCHPIPTLLIETPFEPVRRFLHAIRTAQQYGCY